MACFIADCRKVNNASDDMAGRGVNDGRYSVCLCMRTGCRLDWGGGGGWRGGGRGNSKTL